MSRLASAVRTLAAGTFLALLLGVADGLRGAALPGETLFERLRSTIVLDMGLLTLPALALALLALARPVRPGRATALSAVWLLGLLSAAIATVPRAAARGQVLQSFPLNLPIPALRLPADEAAAPVIVLSIDTLRADAALPRLSERARGALRYSGAHANAPWTLPSMASAMTGRPVAEHGAGRRLDPAQTALRSALDPAIPTLAERLAEAGYVNLAVLTNAYLDPQHGLTRGFDRAFDLTRRALLVRGLRRSLLLAPWLNPEPDDAARVSSRAIEALNRVHEGRFFLWVHYIDAHAPYTRSPGAEGSCRLPDCFDGWPAVRRGERTLSEAEWAQIRALYAAETARLDEQIERFFAELDRLQLWDRALVLLYADHGEELGEHGGGEHGATFYEEVTRVPLYLWAPGRPGGDVKHNVSLADTFETILKWTADRSLGPLDPEAPESPIPMASLLFGEPGSACLDGAYKLIQRGEALSLYDLSRDPTEREDLARELPDQVMRMRDCLPPAQPPGAGPAPADPIGALRALGYVD